MFGAFLIVLNEYVRKYAIFGIFTHNIRYCFLFFQAICVLFVLHSQMKKRGAKRGRDGGRDTKVREVRAEALKHLTSELKGSRDEGPDLL